jgi:mannitol/fructose-specific phosphotransferase system IIA component (Ntr-type)
MPPSTAQILQPSQILLDIAATNKNEAILEVAAAVRRNANMKDYRTFCEELLARDELRSTAAGYGVAFPHARTDAVSEIVIAAGRSKEGVQFGEELVHFIFVIGTPREKVSEYLVAVGTLARQLRTEKVRTALTAATTPEEFARTLNRRG